MTLIEKIKENKTLLSWARYSIRYNSTRATQASDFMSKLTYHRITGFEDYTVAQFAEALSIIDNEDQS